MPGTVKSPTDRMSAGLLCRCGYDAEDQADLIRHIASWTQWEIETRGEAGLEHVED